MRKTVTVWVTGNPVDREADWMMQGELALRIDPNIRNYVVEDKAQGKMWFFPTENVECLIVEDDRRSAEQIDAANDRSPN